MSDGRAMTEHTARLFVSQRSAGRCECCGAEGTNVHHRNKAGRVWTPSNLVRLCGSGTTGCHGRIEAHPDLSQRLGLWVPHALPAAEQAVMCRPNGWWLAWWLLADDGTVTWQDDAEPAERLTYAQLFPHAQGVL